MALAFSKEWATAWCRLLNQSEAYRTAAKAWEGSVLLRIRSSPRAIFLDLHHGRCRAARVATHKDLGTAAFVFEADVGVWKRLFLNQSNPIMALMSGQLELARGELGRLLPYAAAATELLHLVTELETEFDL